MADAREIWRLREVLRQEMYECAARADIQGTYDLSRAIRLLKIEEDIVAAPEVREVLDDLDAINFKWRVKTDKQKYNQTLEQALGEASYRQILHLREKYGYKDYFGDALPETVPTPAPPESNAGAGDDLR